MDTGLLAPVPAVTRSMVASRVHMFGAPEVITLDSIERPVPGAGEVLVRVKAAGVGPWDAWVRAGRSVLPQPLPLTLGSDLAGIVEAMGPGVADFRVGDAVFGVTNPRFIGAYAEYAVVTAGMIAKKPARLDFIDAASVPVVAVTAWQALFEQARLGRGQTVLIHGAAGNVGAYAVQFAERAGLRVIATAGARDLAHTRSLGADEVIDFRSERFEDRARDVDAVIDLVGGETQRRSFAVLRPGGVLVSAVSPPDQDAAARHGVRAVFFLVDITTARLARIAAMIDAGELTTEVGTVLPLAGAQAAHAMLEGTRPHPRGKIVLRVSA
ncbi:MAG TPA: NADP-dependent oxidoreductase [Roseomonas sp.]|jgi:NADPH:quinone reductase-like Zn-dependent oxidoreductase